MDREEALWAVIALAMIGILAWVIAAAPSGAELDAYSECIDQRRIDARLGEPLRDCGPEPRFNDFPDPAQAIEARRAETLQDGSVHESAVPTGCAQPPSGDISND